MELIVLALTLGLSVVAFLGFVATGNAIFWTWYGRRYHSRCECRATDGVFRPSWRTVRLWPLLKTLLRYRDPVMPSSRPVGPVIYSCQPHGELALSAALAVFSGDLDRPGTRTLLVLHDWFWWIPGLRDLMLALGCIEKSWTSIEEALARGYSVAVLPGGVFEMGPPTLPPRPVFGIVQKVYDHRAYKVSLVPVALDGESQNCWIWHGEPSYMKRMRAYSQTNLRLPFPNILLPKVWNWPVHQPRVLAALNANDFSSAESMQQAYTRLYITLTPCSRDG